MCRCCGETDPSYFQIDHVYNDGSQDKLFRDAHWSRRATLIKENPSRYQILCANCNYAKHYNDGKIYIPKDGWVIRKGFILKNETKIFDRELYNKSDILAKKVILDYLHKKGVKTLDHSEDYFCDIKGEDHNWEVEISYAWNKNSWPESWKINIPYRKKRLLDKVGEDNITFFKLNANCSLAWKISGKAVAGSEVNEMSNKYVKKGELFFTINPKDAELITLDNKNKVEYGENEQSAKEIEMAETKTYERAVIKGQAYWTKINKVDEYSNKYQMDIGNLEKDTVKLLESKGVQLKTKDHVSGGPFVIARTARVPAVMDKQRNPFNIETNIGNGSEVKVRVAFNNDHPMVNQYGTSLYLEKVQVLDLVEFNGSIEVDKDFD